MAKSGFGDWVKSHQGASITIALISAAVLYFIGVALFDNSTEDAARERAARENFPAGLTDAETEFARQLLEYGRPEKTLPLGERWCWYFRNDPSPGTVSSWSESNDPGAGYSREMSNAAFDAAQLWLCPDAYSGWEARMPEPQLPADYEPPPDEERDWGPRG